MKTKRTEQKQIGKIRLSDTQELLNPRVVQDV